MSIPEGWLSVHDAAVVAGLSEERVRQLARKIDQHITYTIMGITLDRLKRSYRSGHRVTGVPQEGPEALPILTGNELKRLHRGRVILNAEMVSYWQRAQEEDRALAAAGHKTVAELAKELGVSEKDVRRAAKKIIRKP
jgi:hypothetical protein